MDQTAEITYAGGPSHQYAAPQPSDFVGEVVARSISKYVPLSISDEHWARIEPLVVSAVQRCESKTPYEARQLMIASTGLAQWAWQTAGIPLEDRYVFRHDVITAYVNYLTSQGHLTTSTRGTYRSRLMRMADVLLAGEQMTYRLPGLPPSDPSVPYTAPQVVGLRAWATGQATEARRVNATLLLALGLGAGLSTREILTVSAADVTVDDEGVLIAVPGDRPRVVPVLAEWEEIVAEVANALWKPDMWLFSPRRPSVQPNGIYNFIHRSNDKPFHINAQRLRATWIVTHLSAGTPVQALLDAAGIDTLKAVGRFLEFADTPDPREAREALVRRARSEGCMAPATAYRPKGGHRWRGEDGVLR